MNDFNDNHSTSKSNILVRYNILDTLSDLRGSAFTNCNEMSTTF